jgi:Co/Zn/Cd efflux system component
MSSECCQTKAKELSHLRERQSKVLWIVMTINIVMFVIELRAGLRSDSLSLTGDSLDMLGDSLVYASSLFVIDKSERFQAASAFLKGIIMLASSVAVLARVIYEFVAWQQPEISIMGKVGLLALFANLFCLLLLSSHKDDNLNMASVWLCSRNDIIANVSVLIAAYLILLFQSPIPDLMVGSLLTLLFAKTAVIVMSHSWKIISVRS